MDLKDVKNNLAHLIINNFYENILSPNDKEYHLIYIITTLLKQEINNLNEYCSPTNFLSDSLCSILFDEFYLKEQIQSFCKTVFLDLIELSDSQYSSQEFVFNQDLQKCIKKLGIDNNNIDIDNNSNSNNLLLLFVQKYLVNLTVEELTKQMEKFDNKGMKDYIDRNLITCFEEGKKDVYTNYKFVSNFKKNFNIYCGNFFKVTNLINKFIENILQNLHKLPYSVKCICKIIKILIKKKYAFVSDVEENTFISKFFYEKLLTPFFKNVDLFALFNQNITSNNTHKNFIALKDILSKLLNASFFRTDNEQEENYIPFNLYFIEIMPKILNLFEKITDVKIPVFASKLINDEPENDEFNFFEKNIEDFLFYRNICLSLDQLFSLVEYLNKKQDKILNNKENKKYFIIKKSIGKILDSETYKKLKQYNEMNIIVSNTNEKSYIKEEVKQIENYYIFSDLLIKKNLKDKLDVNNNGKDYFNLTELKEIKNDEDMEKNLIIKIKNLTCNILQHIGDISNFDFNVKNSDIFGILKEFKKYTSSDIFNYNFIPEWNINFLIRYIHKLPKIENNNIENIFNDLESELIMTINKYDFNRIGQITDTVDNMIKYKIYYQKAKQLTLDINLNQIIRQIISNEEIPVILIYDKKTITLKNLENKNKKDSRDSYSGNNICYTIEDFVNEFPDLTTSEDVFQAISNLNVCGLIDTYCQIICNHVKEMKVARNKIEINTINDKIYDYIMEKLYLKLFPKIQTKKDIQINKKISKIQWIEIQNITENKYNFNLDEFLPIIVHYFGQLDKEKSPRKKLLSIDHIFSSIYQLATFNNKKGDDGVDFSLPIVFYALVKAKPTKIDSDCKYIQLFSKKDNIQLTQLLSSCEKAYNFSFEDVIDVNESDYYENCRLSEEDLLY